MRSAARVRRLAALALLCLALASAGCAGLAPFDTIFDRGETLYVRGNPAATFDPALVGDGQSWSYAIQVYSGLVRLDEKLAVVPDLAERWDISPDGRTYTFYLRPGIRFHSGRAVTAEDFRYGIERALRPATGSTVARQYLGDIVGSRELAEGRAENLRGVRVLDAGRLEIEIDAPKPYFLAKLTHPASYPLDRANVESGPTWFERPNGTGPFRLAEWNRAAKITLIRFNQHWTGSARVKSIEFDLTPVSGILRYEQGAVDMTEVGLDAVDRATDPANPLSRDVVRTPILSTWYIGFNPAYPPFDDPNVRRAFALATDRQRLAAVFFRGRRPVADRILPPGLPDRTDGIAAPALNVEAARRALAASTYRGRMPEVALWVGSDSIDLGEALAEMYSRALGIDVGVRTVEGDYFRVLERHEAPMFVTGWIADYPDPEDFLDLLFHSGSVSNYGGYANPAIDLLLDQARVDADPTSRAARYATVERMLLEDAAAIPLTHETTYTLVRPWVTGVTWTPLGIISYHDVEVGTRTVRRPA